MYRGSSSLEHEYPAHYFDEIRARFAMRTRSTLPVIVRGRSGTVKLYRERPGSPRELAGGAPHATDGSVTVMETPTHGPVV